MLWVVWGVLGHGKVQRAQGKHTCPHILSLLSEMLLPGRTLSDHPVFPSY
jgi:hypothetical protein